MKKVPKNHFEHGVMCGVLTDVPLTMPVDCRQNHVDGIGQLCEHCRRQQDRN